VSAGRGDRAFLRGLPATAEAAKRAKDGKILKQLALIDAKPASAKPEKRKAEIAKPDAAALADAKIDLGGAKKGSLAGDLKGLVRAARLALASVGLLTVEHAGTESTVGTAAHGPKKMELKRPSLTQLASIISTPFGSSDENLSPEDALAEEA